MAVKVSFTNIPVCTMEKHQAEQEERLVEIQIETGLKNSEPEPTSVVERNGCFKFVVALATVMGLILVTSFIIYYFLFVLSCKTDDAPRPGSSATEKATITYQLKESDEKGRYDIFTAEKDATYLIYGWVMREDCIEDEFNLQYSLTETRTIQTEISTASRIFFFNKVRLLNSSRVYLFFKYSYLASFFHVYEVSHIENNSTAEGLCNS